MRYQSRNANFTLLISLKFSIVQNPLFLKIVYVLIKLILYLQNPDSICPFVYKIFFCWHLTYSP